MTDVSKGMRAAWSVRRKEMLEQKAAGWRLCEIAKYHKVNRSNVRRMMAEEKRRQSAVTFRDQKRSESGYADIAYTQ